MEPIPKDAQHTTIRVRRDFCHSSYWEHTKNEWYGYLEKNGEFGHLYTCERCAPKDIHMEGYEWCEGCDTLFNDESLSIGIYEKSGMILCPYCAREYILENIDEFTNEGMPNFDKPIPSINLDALELEHPRLKLSNGSAQGWCASIPVPKSDIGYGTWRDEIARIVEREHKWLVIVGGAGVTHNICSIAVDVYEVLK